MTSKEKVKEVLQLRLGCFMNGDEPEDLLEKLVEEIDLAYNIAEAESLDQRRKKFIELLTPYADIFGREQLNAFSKYWLERSPGGKKFRFEKEKVFDVKRRLATWAKNSKNFSIVALLKNRF